MENSNKIAVGVRIRKLGDSWWIDVHRDHKRYRSNLRVLTRDEARLEALGLLTEVKAGRLTLEGLGLKVQTAIDKFLAYLDQKHRAKNTIKNTSRILGRFNTWLKNFSIVALSEIKQSTLDQYLQWRVSQPVSRTKRSTAPTTANSELRRVGAFLNWATVRRRYLTDNPARGFEYLREMPKKKRALRLDEIEKLAAFSNPLMSDIILTAGHTGPRITELLQATVSDVDLEGHELLDQKGHPTVNILFRATKTFTERRVPLNDVALPIMRRRMLAAGTKSDALLFTTPRGRAVSRRNARRDMMAAARRACINPKGCTPQAIRRGFCTRMAALVPAATLQYLVGHADARTTNRFYRGAVAVVPPVASRG